ncbi:polygalacturonase 1 beta-like protein 3 [Benincasa hispida]|uniref:polygalacturonase 1 beta-like protein 3 n=1 Tax=Benincasa hispida TaxID=102211 RepID=UPI0018FF8979|nr:polygalacturonase 1 beta-like protein 3 [Benincasa hispida]
MVHIVFFLLLSQLSLSFFHVSFASADHQQSNPFTAKASLLRYWNSHVSNQLPPPDFLFSKASPLSAVDAAVLAQHAARGSLSFRLESFCYSANLFCSFDSETEISVPRLKDADFKLYGNKNFVNYGGARLGGTDSFKNYSDGLNTADHSFKRYGGNSSNHEEGFTNYAEDGNVANSNFISYATESKGGSGEFVNYDKLVNVPNLRFTAYDLNSRNHKLSFTGYGNETNSGSQTFTSYGKKGNGVPQEFSSYSDGSNILTSTFTGYGESGKTANDSFKGYGVSGNNPHTNFKNYGKGGNSEIDTFSNYRNGANVGDDSFQSYAKNSNSGRVNFANYGKSFNHGNDSFTEYGKGSIGRTTVGFKSYSVDRNFTTYAQKGVSFSEYSNFTTATGSGIHVNKLVEPGKFFRESELKQGNVMVMPDIRDKMPPRSFLPRPILVNLPFSSSRISEAKEIFHARDGSTMERVITNALGECERAPSPGETKRCVGSAEDMIDFATTVLGRRVVARTTANVNGSREKVEIGTVKGINGGDLTSSVSCHQSLYPYLLYYCHSVPKVRIYEADILRLKTKEKINRGVAICHMDTSSWGPEHGAFVALGSGPGQIEVCHWIFENDMSWSVAD